MHFYFYNLLQKNAVVEGKEFIAAKKQTEATKHQGKRWLANAVQHIYILQKYRPLLLSRFF